MLEDQAEIRCPKCKGSIFPDDDQAGQRIECPRCQSPVLVPGSVSQKTDASPSTGNLLDFEFDDDLLDDPVKTVDNVAARMTGPVESKSADPVDSDDPLALAPLNLEAAKKSTTESARPTDQTDVDEAPDDLGDLLAIPETQPSAKPVAGAKDPFEIRDDGSLVIDGVSPQDGQFPISCQLCGTLLYARISQAGTQIKCHDCHSLIDVVPPEKEPVQVAEPEDDLDGEPEGYRLSEPVELDSLDNTVDISLGKIDYDDDELLARKRRIAAQRGETFTREGISSAAPSSSVAESSKTNDELQLSAPIDDPFYDARVEPAADVQDKDVAMAAIPVEENSADYRLSPVPEDVDRPQTPTLGAPIGTTGKRPARRIPQSASNRQSQTRTRSVDGAGDAKSTESNARKSATGKGNRKTKRNSLASGQSSAVKPADFPGCFHNLGNWLGSAFKPLASGTSIVFLVLCVLALGTCYLIEALGVNLLGSESHLYRLGGVLIIGVGFIPLVLTFLFVGSIGNSVIHEAIEQSGDPIGAPEFSLAEWIAQFLFVGTSFWMAGVPGILIGGVLFSLTLQPAFVVIAVAGFSLLFTPIFLSSVVYHESPWALVTGSVFASMGKLRNRWLRFFLFALLAAAIVPACFFLILLHPVLGFVAALIQVFVLVFYWQTLGDLVGNVVRWIIETGKS